MICCAADIVCQVLLHKPCIFDPIQWEVIGCTMADKLSQFIDLIGISEETGAYLTEGLKYKIPEVVAKVGATDKEFAGAVVDALKEGVTIRDKQYKFGDEDNPEVVRAQLACLWDKCRQEATRVAAEAVPRAEAQAVAPFLPPPPPVFDPNKNKPPKFLAPGVWQARIAAFEDEWQGKRKFPYKLLVGAEDVLARLLWEKEVSNIYTPLKLGEVIAARSYNSCGKINTWSTEKSNKDVLQMTKGGEGVELVAKEWTFTPRSMEMIQDALEAVKWALVFAGYGNDVEVGAWTEKFLINLKTKKNTELTKDLYAEAALALAMEMREGKSFEEASTGILKDGPWWSDYVANWTPKDKGIKRDRDGREKRNGDGGHQGNQSTGICRHWSRGHCRNGNMCKFRHVGSRGQGDPYRARMEQDRGRGYRGDYWSGREKWQDGRRSDAGARGFDHRQNQKKNDRGNERGNKKSA